MFVYGTNAKEKLPSYSALSSFSRFFPLSLHTGFFVMLPTSRHGQDAILLHSFVKPFQSAFKWFVFSDNNLRHKPSLPLIINTILLQLLFCRVIIAFPYR